MKVLYVDDIRTYPNQYKGQEIDLAKNYDSAIRYIKTNSYDIIDLDHDLGEEKTGYDICKYIIENQIQCNTYYLHTANPVGRSNMKQLLERYTNSQIRCY